MKRWITLTLALLLMTSAGVAHAKPQWVQFYLKCSDGTPISHASVAVTYTTSDLGTVTDYGTTYGEPDVTPENDGLAQVVLRRFDGVITSGSFRITSPECGSVIEIPVGTPEPFDVICPDCKPLPPACSTAPDGMLDWFTFDESSGTHFSDALGDYSLHSEGSPAHLFGQPFGNALYFSAGNRLRGDLNFQNPGSGDFSVDFWVRDSSGANTSDVRTLLDCRHYLPNGLPGGFTVFLGGPNYPTMPFSVVGFQLANASLPAPGFTNFWSLAAIGIDEWHHIAITVKRDDPQGGRIYVDGANVTRFDPTARAGDLRVQAPLVVGDRAIDGPSPAHAAIDEIEFFDHALDSTQVLATMGHTRADTLAGKCKDLLTIPRIVSVCGTDWAPVSFELCNESGAARSYSLDLSSSDLLVQALSPSGTQMLLPHECRTFTFQARSLINGGPMGTTHAYQVTAFGQDWGATNPVITTSVQIGAFVQRQPSACITSDQQTQRLDPNVFTVVESVLVQNPTDSSHVYIFSVSALRDSVTSGQVRIVPARWVRLGELEPGSVYRDSLVLEPHTNGMLRVLVTFTRSAPYSPVQILFRAMLLDSSEAPVVSSVLVHPALPPQPTLGVEPRPLLRTTLALAAGPNPTPGPLTFGFALPRPAAAWLEVFDVNGRLVRRLLEGRVMQGWNTLRWDGRDHSGGTLHHGLYFARLRAGGETVTQRVVIAR